MSRPLKPCGTRAAYERHRRRGEPIDDACREANRLESAARLDAALASGVPEGILHGYNGYTNYGCRCGECFAAGQRANRAGRERRSRQPGASAR